MSLSKLGKKIVSVSAEAASTVHCFRNEVVKFSKRPKCLA